METASKEEVKDFVKQSVKELASFELLLKKVLDEQMHLRFQLILYSELMKNILQDKFWSHPDLEGVVKSRSVLHLRTNSESSETSDIPLFLILFKFRLIFLSSLFRFCSSLLPFLSDPFLFVMQLLTMLTQPNVPAIAPPPELCTRSSSRTPIPVPAPPLDSELLLYLNPLYLSIQPNLIIVLLMLRFTFSSCI